MTTRRVRSEETGDRLYVRNAKPSNTSILKVIDGEKSMRFAWSAATHQLAYDKRIARAAIERLLGLGPEEILSNFEEEFDLQYMKTLGRQRAHTVEWAKARDTGTGCHAAVERDLTLELKRPWEKDEPTLSEDGWRSYFGWQSFRKLVPFIPIRVEEMVETDDWAGTPDGLGNFPSLPLKRPEAIYDLKTGGLYEEAWLQVSANTAAAYKAGWFGEPTFDPDDPKADGELPEAVLIHLPREVNDPAFDVSRDVVIVRNTLAHYRVFKHALALWNWLPAVKKEMPKKVKK